MKRSLLLRFLGFMIVVSMLAGMVGIQPAFAAGLTQATLNLTTLGMNTPTILTGPVSEHSVEFNFPVEWFPEESGKLTLNISAFFSSLVATESTDAVSGLVGGDLSAYLNDTLLGVTTLTQAGQQSVQFDFDASILKLASKDSVNELRIRWDGSISCSMNLLSSVTVYPDSVMEFSFADNPKSLSINDFPVPFIVEGSIEPVALKIVIPANPSAAELQAAMIVAAGVGQISNGQAQAELISIANYHPTTGLKQNILLVANNDTLQTLDLASLGISSQIGPVAGEGVLHYFKPAGGYGLLVSGDETGIIKAAQVLAANQTLAAGDPATMFISAVNPPAVSMGQQDMTLADLGAGELVFSRPNQLDQSVEFYIPAGNQVRADASFDLVISHSQQLDYLNSSLQVKVNGYPAVSLRLNDNTSNQNLFTLIMPANLIRPGRNTVEFAADLNIRNLCTPPVESVAWLRVSSDSVLHLPLETAVGGSSVAKKFGDFPDAFFTGSGLNDVLLMIAPDDFGNLEAAARLAMTLGAGAPHNSIFQLNALYSNAPDTSLASGMSTILVGKPSDFAILSDKSAFPSLVFDADNTLSSQSAVELVSKPEAGANLGYIAIRGYDSSTSRVLMAVLGNTSTGVTQAVEAVINPKTAEYNFGMVTTDQALTSWLDEGIATGNITITPPASATETPAENPVQLFRSSMLKWVVPALAISLALALLFLYFEIRQGLRKNR